MCKTLVLEGKRFHHALPGMAATPDWYRSLKIAVITDSVHLRETNPLALSLYVSDHHRMMCCCKCVL